MGHSSSGRNGPPADRSSDVDLYGDADASALVDELELEDFSSPNKEPAIK